MNDTLVSKIVAFIVAASGSGVGIAAGIPPEIAALAFAMTADVVTGVLCGFKGHRVSSNTLKAGLKEKLGIAIAVGLFYMLEPLGFPSALTFLATFGFVATEALSIVENLDQLGVPIPDVIRRRLESFRTRNDSAIEETENEKSEPPV